MLSRDSLLFSPTRDGVPSSDDDFTANDILQAQAALEEEAREAIPYSQSSGCTYDQGYVKQPVFACQTCLNFAGVCASCSIACHGEHELVELFMRRDFRCDCGTSRMGAGSCCNLTKRADAAPNDNRYDKSFKGSFCICGKPYDPHTETDSMYQCITCEDWLHHACVFGSHADTNDSPLGTDDFDMLVCAACVKSDPRVRRIMDRWAGVEGSGVMMVDKDDKVIGRTPQEEEEAEEETEAGATATVDETTEREGGEKRKADTTTDEPAMKKAKLLEFEATSSSSSSAAAPSSSSASSALAASTAATDASSSEDACIAPPVVPDGESVLMRLEKEGARMNVFLEEGWIECINSFISFPYFLEEEEVLEPEDDPDAQKSTMELGLEALEKMPRGASLDAMHGYKHLEDRLKAFLQPVAESGRSVTKEDIASFFEMMQEERRELAATR
ncbi:hypothetical protein RQP46_006648 [Phenoliferia psychrophenolica]